LGSSPLARGAHSLSCGSLSLKADSSSTCFYYQPLDPRTASHASIFAVLCSTHAVVMMVLGYLVA
ncbi:hypothetical protein, partial [Corynebacterium sp. HMSC058E07]|uniref:hypothetical protein n=1 Tax=Corynebacterium sp. HMSC058E07 TaxID=1715157 RepID=UPI001AEFBE3F